ncbi:dipeptide/oligopeptide/nickel ABC transporter ATP-binding protein [Alicyclobacillus cellulosilyticus]|uniref:Dipeptide/oligopeptide/nickel ABC transporter ATP-binding protein n=1 Tax=Alicyclobacillus cellulosilyticus TaxID=1003997 RepID=A0A917K4D1_9BACL|nr:ABC transporter ATP-binding protein [Alicyclobacillus cellulosilyticus]GGI97751.1 dipeptide/oligopeptide/nickel ABC transporter ATP-binding protein [Alicyclobacillus cellulosilyticus]
MSEASQLIEVRDLVVRFPIRDHGKRTVIQPVDHVSFGIRPGEVLALVGESGSGKSTIARTLLRIVTPSAGSILFDGQDVTRVKGRALAQYRRNVQMVFQDPFSSLNPARTIEAHLSYPLRKHHRLRGKELGDRIDELLERVGLTPTKDIRLKYPHELSGGQRQRVAIARALAVSPRFLVADEPISMLDVSIRAGVLKLMDDLRAAFNLAYLYITHDLASARYFGDRIMVLYGGRVMETAPSDDLIRNPSHPYTRLLLAATPGSGHRGKLPETSNRAPNLAADRKGCPFAERCPLATSECHEVEPPVVAVTPEHTVACHHVTS